MKLEEIKEILKEFQERNWKKVRLKQGDFELELEQEGSASAPSVQHLPTPAEPATTEAKASVSKTDSGIYITSPMVGTFYESPSPEQPAFVKVGDRVDENSVVCIVEAMKVMNEVKAGKKGVVAEILIDNAQPVEFGTKLFRIE